MQIENKIFDSYIDNWYTKDNQIKVVKIMQMVNFENGMKAVSNFRECVWVDYIKVTSVEQFDFNDMIGYQCLITIKVVPVKGYKGRMFQIITNSTWLDEIDSSLDIKTALQLYLNEL